MQNWSNKQILLKIKKCVKVVLIDNKNSMK